MKCFVFVLFVLVSSSTFADEMNRLYVESGSASSFLQSNWNKYQENYHPNYAFDDNPATAWVEGVDGNGENESLEWEVSKLDHADELQLVIFNGYQKSKSLLAANGSAKDVEITVYGAKPQFHFTIKWTLENKMGPQTMNFKLPENHGLTKFRLMILSAYAGKTYKDTCISDIKVMVKSKVPYNPGTENEKLTKLKSWIKERLDAAKFFANQPASYPFSSSNFEKDDERWYYLDYQGRNLSEASPGITYTKDFKTAHKFELLKEGLAFLRYKTDFKSKGPWSKAIQKNPTNQYLPDGFEGEAFGQSMMKFFHPEELTFFEVNSPVAEVLSQKQTETSSPRDEKTSQYLITKNNNKLAAISWATHIKGMERGPYEYNENHVLAFIEGKLIWYVKESKGEGIYQQITKFGYDRNDKVNEVTRISYTPESDYDIYYHFEHFIPKTTTVVKK